MNRQRILACLILMFFFSFSSSAFAVRDTFYLTSAGQDFADDPANWNDIADGSGNALPDFSFANGDTTVLIIPIGISGTVEASFSLTGGNTSFTTIDVLGTLIFKELNVITFTGSLNTTPRYDINVSGTIEFRDLSSYQIQVGRTTIRFTFNLNSSAELISYNEFGLWGGTVSNNECIRWRAMNGAGFMTVNLNTGANYNYVGLCGTKGMPSSVNNLDISGGGVTTLFSSVTVNGALTIANGDVFDVDANTLTIPGAFAPTTGTIRLTTGTLSVSGNFTHTTNTNIDFESGTLDINGSLIMTSGTMNLETGTLSCASTISRSTGLIYGPTGTIEFANSSSITIPSNLFLTYPANFNMNGSGGIVLGGKTTSLTDSIGFVTFTNGNITLTGDTTAINGTSGTGGNFVSNQTATLKFYGSNSFTARLSQTSAGVSNAVKNVIIRGTSAVTLGNALRVVPSGLVDIGTGSSLTTSGNLTIVSNASGHARIGTVSGTLTSSSSDSMQLFIPGGTRGYRLFGNPFTSALAISQFMNSATEIDITGSGGSNNGFTTTVSNNPSAYLYNTSGNSWDAFTSTSQTIPVGFGAHILVRGIKGEGLAGTSYTPSAATIRLAGQFRSGNVTTTLSDAGFGWNLVANPYPSNIDIDQITSPTNWTNVSTAIYGYDKVSRTYSSYVKGGGGSTNNLSNIIEMGSSFLAEVAVFGSASSITFTESIKTSASSTVNSNPIFTPKDERINRFKLSLVGQDENSTRIKDECFFSFGNVSTATDEFDAVSDAWDLGGELIDIGIIAPNSKILSINEFPSLSGYTKTIPLNVWGKVNGNYIIEFTEVSPIEEGVSIYLRDKFTGNVHDIQNGNYSFDISDMEGSYGTSRFELFTNFTSGTNKIVKNSPLKVFPNPINSSNSSFDVYLSGENHGFVKCTILDMSGRTIYSSATQHIENNKTVTVKPNFKLSPQTYILSCQTKQGIFNQQIIITE